MSHYLATLVDVTAAPTIQTVCFESGLTDPCALLARAREIRGLPGAHVELLKIPGPVEAGWMVRMQQPAECGQVLLIPAMTPMSAADAKLERLLCG